MSKKGHFSSIFAHFSSIFWTFFGLFLKILKFQNSQLSSFFPWFPRRSLGARPQKGPKKDPGGPSEDHRGPNFIKFVDHRTTFFTKYKKTRKTDPLFRKLNLENEVLSRKNTLFFPILQFVTFFCPFLGNLSDFRKNFLTFAEIAHMSHIHTTCFCISLFSMFPADYGDYRVV